MRAVVEGFDVLGNRKTHAHIENMNTYTITKQQYCYLLPTYGLAATADTGLIHTSLSARMRSTLRRCPCAYTLTQTTQIWSTEDSGTQIVIIMLS